MTKRDDYTLSVKGGPAVRGCRASHREETPIGGERPREPREPVEAPEGADWTTIGAEARALVERLKSRPVCSAPRTGGWLLGLLVQ